MYLKDIGTLNVHAVNFERCIIDPMPASTYVVRITIVICTVCNYMKNLRYHFPTCYMPIL